MEQLPRDAAVICAHLIRQGFIKKSQLPFLEIDEHLFQEVQKSLARVGMELVYNSYSRYYAVRIQSQAQEVVEDSNNLGLKNNEIAMLVILWSKLVLPKRIGDENPSPPAPNRQASGESEASKAKSPEGGEYSLFPNDPVPSDPSNNKDEKDDDEPEKTYIRVPELYAEFGEHFGSKTTFKAILTRLANLEFIRIHNELVSEGILLDLLIDGYQMANEIKKSALAFKLAGIVDDDDWFEEEEEQEEEEQEALPDGQDGADGEDGDV